MHVPPQNVQIKRIYDPPEPTDGRRILVDRLWPRGVSKSRAAIDEWAKEVSPSPELRKWFKDHPERFETFRKRYIEELLMIPEKSKEIARLRRLAAEEKLTLLYAKKNPDCNHALVLAEVIRGTVDMEPPSEGSSHSLL